MTAIRACPEVATLERFLLNQLHGSEGEQVEEHLSHCDACLTKVESACGQHTIGDSLRGQPVAAADADEPVVVELIERVRRLRLAPARETASGETHSHEPAPASVDPLSVLGPAQSPGELGRLGGYRILKLLGQGGMGAVFHAEDPALGRPVALKVMLPSLATRADSKQRFLREARAAAQLRSDHVVVIHQVGEERGVPFLAMELLPGLSLDDWLKKGNKPTIAQVLRLGREMARGLAAAHAKELVHRDVKPANVWLEAPTGRVKLLDFGLARPQEATDGLTREGQLVGTPAFMSPEQIRGETVDSRADLFSLGVVLYRLCTGQLPFRGSTTMSQLATVLFEEAKPVRELNPDVPPALADLVMKLLAKTAGDRPASANAVAEALQRIATKRVPSAGDTAPCTQSEPRPSGSGAARPPLSDGRGSAGRRRALAACAGLAAAVLLGVIVIRIKDKKTGLETTITVPDTNTVTIKHKGDEAAVTPPADPPRAAFVPPGAPSPLDKLDAAKIPAAERFPWQPRELVAVIGEHRQRHWGNCTALAFSPDGKYAASGGDDSRIVIYDAATQNQLHVLHKPGVGILQVTSLAFSPDGLQLAAGYRADYDWSRRQVCLWDLRGIPSIKSGIVDGSGWGNVLFLPPASWRRGHTSGNRIDPFGLFSCGT